MLRTVADLPGPRPWPLVGNTLQLDLFSFHLNLEDWVDEYGPAYFVNMGGRDVIVVSDPAWIRELLKRRPDHIRRAANMAAVAEELGFDGLFTAEGEQWRKQRKLMNTAFAPKHLRTLAPALIEITERLRQVWSARARLGEPVDIHADLRAYSTDVTMRVAFGEDVDLLRQGSHPLREMLDDVFPFFHRRIMAIVPYWRYIKLPRDRALDRRVASLGEEMGRRIDAARARVAADPELAANPTNLLEAMVAARDHDDPALRLNDEEVRANALTLLLAGEDTTSNTAAWMLAHLARAPAVQERLRAEVDGELGEARGSGLEALDRMPYVNGTVREALRLRSTAPLTLMTALEDGVIGDIAYKKGMDLCLLGRKGCLQAEHFGEARRFEPGRWLDDERDPSWAHDPRALLTFGYGPRLCPGRGLGMFELGLVAAMVARNFILEPTDEPEPAEVFGFTMSPSSARVILRLRED